MSKRMTDTGKWDKSWFQNLPVAYKLFWFYILDRCDLAGIWDVNLKAASFFIGAKITIDGVRKNINGQLYEINDRYWLVTDFIRFQNGWPLNDKSPVHKKIIDLLDSKGIEIKDNTLYDRVQDRVCHTQIVIVRVEGGVGGTKFDLLIDGGWDEDLETYNGILTNYPKLFKLKRPLLFKEHERLVKKWGLLLLKDIYRDMEAWGDLKKKDWAGGVADKWCATEKSKREGRK